MMTRKLLIRHMRRILLRRREALRLALAGELGLFSAWEGPVVGDSVDEALQADYGAVNSQLAETESRELAAIDNALERMEAGDFGVCENCGRDIPVARLHALPYATTCVACQRSVEAGRTARDTEADWSRVHEADEGGEDLTLDSIELVS